MKALHFIFVFLLTASISRGAPTNDAPKFDEVYQLLRAHLQSISKSELDDAALKGLLDGLHGQASLVDNDSARSAESNSTNGLARAACYSDAFAYFRFSRISGNVAEKFRAAYDDMARTNKSKIKGVVLDLRFAGGRDYAAAAAVADCFLNSDQPLVNWGDGSAHATKKENAITAPVAILVNSKTSGAAEALAAILRASDIGLAIGSPTAREANIFEEFPLTNGDKLRIAIAPIKLGDGTTLVHGFKPDISVKSSLADEKAYLADPYKELHPPAVASTATNTAATTPHRRINEAELVRERKAGENLDDEFIDENLGPEQPGPPVMNDAVLVRALDLLKGLAVLQENHPG